MSTSDKNLKEGRGEPFPPDQEKTTEQENEDNVVFSYGELASFLECSEEDVRRAVRMEKNPLEGMRVLKQAKLPYIAVMGSFEARKRGDIMGVFCFLASSKNGEVVEKKIWASYGVMEKGFSIDAQWEAVRGAVDAIELEKEPESGVLKELLLVLDSYITPTSVNLLARSEKERQSFSEKIKEGLSGAFHMDCFVRVRMELLSEERVRKVLTPEVPPDEKPEKEDDLFEGDKKTYSVACSPAVDPARGKAVVRLREGDCVEVLFPYGSGLGNLICRYLDKVGRRPSFSVISKKKLHTGDYIVEIFVSEGIVGIFKASPNLMVRTGGQEAVPGEGFFEKGDFSFMAFLGTNWHIFVVVFLVCLILFVIYSYLL